MKTPAPTCLAHRLPAPWLSLTVALGSVAITHAAPLNPADILVTREDAHQLVEFTTTGTAVQTFNVPNVGGATETLRDMTIGPNGAVELYNGTFTPVISTLTPATGVISNQAIAGFGTFNNGSYGGIATLGSYVYATSQTSQQGIVRLNLSDHSSTFFGTASGYQDLTIGGNGLLYAIPSSNSFIDVFDPNTLAFKRSIKLNSALIIADIRGIAVNYDGKIYAAGFNGSLYALDGNGNILNTRATGFNNLTDIDIDSNGRLLAGSRFGNVVLTDTTLNTQTTFTDSSGGIIFVAFATPLAIATVPEPGSILYGLGAFGIMGLSLLQRRSRATE